MDPLEALNLFPAEECDYCESSSRQGFYFVSDRIAAVLMVS